MIGKSGGEGADLHRCRSDRIGVITGSAQQAARFGRICAQPVINGSRHLG
jgi:hypothetical protein